MNASRGFALLESMLALLLLATSGIALASLVREVSTTMSQVREEERTLESALSLMDAVSLWPAADLDRHLGTRPEGPWHLTVLRPEPALYDVRIVDSAETRELVRTRLYRPEETHAER